MIAIIAWIKHNFWYKVLALALSVALWMYVVNTYNPLTTLEVRASVEPRNVPKGLVATRIAPTEMHVQLRGRARALEPLEEGDGRLRLVADLAHRSAGAQQDVLLKPSEKLPPGVDIIGPPLLQARVHLEEVAREQRQVFVQQVGFAAEGFRCRVEGPERATVWIRGPRNAVDSVRRAIARIDISDLDTPTDFKPVLQALDVEGQPVQGVTMEPERVDVRVIVEPVPHRPLIVQPVFGNPPPGYQLDRFSARPTTVVVSGPAEVLDELWSIQTATIDLTGVTERTTRSVRLAPPPGVSIRGAATATVTVFLKPVPRLATPPNPPPGAREGESDEGGRDEEAATDEAEAGGGGDEG